MANRKRPEDNTRFASGASGRLRRLWSLWKRCYALYREGGGSDPGSTLDGVVENDVEEYSVSSTVRMFVTLFVRRNERNYSKYPRGTVVHTCVPTTYSGVLIKSCWRLQKLDG